MSQLNGKNPIPHAMSIDVEDYFMVSSFEDFVPKDKWATFESRVVANTRRIMDIMDEYKTKGTFFIVGWVAENHPKLVKEIHDRGHEIGCHGYFHELAYNMTPDQFRKDLEKTKHAIEKASGAPVYGYRAPSLSLVKDSKWVLDILAEEGFRYDSSILPARHARGGFNGNGVQRYPFQVNNLMEFPISTIRMMGRNFAFAGGGYFRLFPYFLTKFGVQQCQNEGQPAVLYLHPWEFDPDQPRMPVRGINRFKHYVNLDQTEQKFRRLLNDFKFAPVIEVLEPHLAKTH